MSTNIDVWEQVGGGELRIHKRRARNLKKKIGNWSPSEFLEGFKFDDDGYAVVDIGSLRGEGSGTCYHEYMGDIAATLDGEADFAITWDGIGVTGLRISGGKAIEMDVVMTLKEKA